MVKVMNIIKVMSRIAFVLVLMIGLICQLELAETSIAAEQLDGILGTLLSYTVLWDFGDAP